MSTKVIITSQKTGDFWQLHPYSPRSGVSGAPIYKVPTYRMRLSHGGVFVSDFKVIRFGLTRIDQHPPPQKRRCNVGLFVANTYRSRWIPTYSVHSGPGSMPGAWQLTGNFLIHEGSPTSNEAWGTYGCVEVVGRGEWRRFVQQTKHCQMDRLTVEVRAVANAPIATLHRAARTLKSAFGR